MNRDWLDINVLEDYLDGKLDAKTMHMVEREALDDPFVSEALAGLSASPKRASQSISLLQKQLHERVAAHKDVKKASVITWQRLSIAATAAVMFVAVSIMFWLRENNQQKELAGRAKKVDVTIAPATPAIEPPVVQTAPVIANESSADRTRDREIDKAVQAAKINTYAARVATNKEIRVPQASSRQSEEIIVVGVPTQYKRNTVGPLITIASMQSQNILSGKVVAGDNGKPLAGVSVAIAGSHLTTVTDLNGEFKIKADTSLKEGKLRINSLGFETTELLAKANQPVNISLAQDKSALNEVIVVEYNKAKKQRNPDSTRLKGAVTEQVATVRIRGVGTLSNNKAMISNPVGGWDKLWAYLQQNNAFRKERKTGQVVEVSFKIDQEGRPEDIRIEKGGVQKYELEAVRLILNGPKWEKPENSAGRMTFKIDF